MDETDAFFTHTVVGAPFTTLLGKRMPNGRAQREGLTVNLDTGDAVLTALWRDWIVLSHHGDTPGHPRRRPGKVRRWLERHALWLAFVGVCSLLTTAIYWGTLLWK